jgi:hypothetical protein
VRAANQAGGVDNVSVILFELLEGASLEQSPEELAPTLEQTAEDVTAVVPAADDDVARHGAGEGSRAAALSAILLIALATGLLLWWSIR